MEPVTNTQYKERPLSPHISIYKWHLSMVMSILHRATGVALVFGGLLAAWLLIAAALGADLYNETTALINTYPGYLILFGWTVAFYYHLFNGIRHLLWDTGYGFKLPVAQRNGIIVLMLTVIFTALTWCCAMHCTHQ